MAFSNSTIEQKLTAWAQSDTDECRDFYADINRYLDKGLDRAAKTLELPNQTCLTVQDIIDDRQDGLPTTSAPGGTASNPQPSASP